MLGLSARRWWDLSAGETLGYAPREDAERYAADVQTDVATTPGAPQGGAYAQASYTLDRQR